MAGSVNIPLKVTIHSFVKKVLGLYVIWTAIGFNPPALGQPNVRLDISMDSKWKTVKDERDSNAFKGFEKQGYNDKNWLSVDVPHNWDNYYGYRRLKHR